jgi:hypothetical protein
MTPVIAKEAGEVGKIGRPAACVNGEWDGRAATESIDAACLNPEP